jgi:hypothetical protein
VSAVKALETAATAEQLLDAQPDAAETTLETDEAA